MSKSRQSKLSKALGALRVPRESVALSWLGQAGFVLKSPQGQCIVIDPYLSDSCEKIGQNAGINMKRQIPAPLFPEDLLGFQAILITHSHQDHLDPDTLRPYLRTGSGRLIAPHEASDQLRSIGTADDRISLTWPNHVLEVGDFSIRATFAIPFAGDDLTHVGYLISVQGGPRIYFTGDTDYNEILEISVAPHQPDIMVTVINPAFRNLSPREAARLAKAIGPRWVIPTHHDMFPDNSLPDRLLRTNLLLQGIQETFCPLKHGEIRVFDRKDFAPAKNRVPNVSRVSPQSRRKMS
jgi:L-ascorbate 6-phosphate lactonase